MHIMLIYEYIRFHYHLEANWFINGIIKLKYKQHKLRKLSKMVVPNNDSTHIIQNNE